MNMKTTKFLAVLAVFAMAFAGFAIVTESQQNDATATSIGDGFSFEVTGTGYELKIDQSTGKIIVTGVVSADPTSGYSTSDKFAAAEYAVAKITGFTAGKVYTVTQYNDALKEFVGESAVTASGNTYKKTTTWTAADSGEGAAALNAYWFLVPKNLSTVTIEIACGDDIVTYEFDFTKVSTQVTLGSDSIATKAETKWEYVVDTENGTNTLKLKGYVGSTIFTSSVNLTIDVKGTNKITSYGFAKSTAIYMGAGSHTLNFTNADTDTANDTLTIDLQAGAYGIYNPTTLTVTETHDHGDLTINISGGNRAIDCNTLKVEAGAELNLSGTEMAIRARTTTAAGESAGSVIVDASTINAYIESPEAGNNEGIDSIFAMRLSGGLTIKNGSAVTTEGLTVNTGTTTAQGTWPGLAGVPIYNSASTLYVTGEYTQSDYANAYGVAGLFNGSTDTAAEAEYISKASGGIAGHNYIVGDADAYNVTMTGSRVIGTTTPAAAESADALITAINEAAAGKTDLTVVLANAVTGATSLDLSALLKKSNVANLDSITIVKTTGPIASLTASEAISITNTSLKIVGLSFTGTVTNGTDNTARFSGVSGSFGIEAGSIKINGQPATGTVYVKGAVELSGTVDDTFVIANEEGATATVEVMNGFSVAATSTKNASITFKGVGVSFDNNVAMNHKGAYTATMIFAADAYLLSDLTIVGSDNTKCTVSITEKQTKNISLSNVTIGSDITTTKKLAVASGTTATTNSIDVGELDIALGATLTVTGAGSTFETVKVSGDMNIAGTVTLTLVKMTVDGISTVSGDLQYTDNKTIITNNGTMTVTGIISKDGGLSASSDDVVVNNGVMVIKGQVVDLTNNKTVRLYGIIGIAPVGTGTGTGYLNNEGTIYIMDEDAKIYYEVKTGAGTIDTSAVSEEVTLSGTLKTTTEFTEYQIVTFTADTTITKGTELTFLGNAIIPMGVTVTIEDKALMTMSGAIGKLTNAGTIAVEGVDSTNGAFKVDGAEVINDGIIAAGYSGSEAGKAIVITDGSKITNNGTITIGEKNVLSNAAANFINAKTGSITVFGSFANTGIISNSGAVTISSEENAELTISNAASGATVTISQAVGNVTVNDAKFGTNSATFKNGGNSVALAKEANVTSYGGITIVSTTYKYSSTITATALAISGAFSVSTAAAATTSLNVDMTISSTDETYGCVGVTDSLLLSNVDLTINNKSELYVSGTVGIDDTCTIVNNGALTVTGTVSSLVAPATVGTINAAQYEIPANAILGTKKTYVYTNVPDAVAGAALATVKTVAVTGTVEIEKNVIVPAGMTLRIDGATVTIKEDVEVEIYGEGTDFAVLNSTGAITVEGKLVIDDVTKSKKGAGTIASEVILKSGNTEVYTTLTWAMSDVGTEEATLTLCGPTVVKTNTTIPENITIDTNNNDFTVQNAELTIDGGLFLNGGNYKVTGDNGKVIVNGAITKESKMTHDGIAYPDGLYFHTLDSALYVIANIADAEACALVADSGMMTYYGDLKVTSVDFDAEGTLVFDGKVEVKTMEIGSKAKVTFSKDASVDLATVGVSTITFADDVHIDGTFVSPVGTISFADTYAVDESKITVATASDVTTMTLTGAIGNLLALEDYQVATLGDVIVKANLAELTVGLGTVTVGANVTIGVFEVYGDLVIDNGFKMKSLAGLVYGSLVAKEATDTKAKAIAEISYLGIGITPADDTSAAAVVSGQVDVDYALVAADAVAPESITAMPYATDVYVELAEFLTIYGTTAASVDWIFTYMPVDFDISDPNAEFVMWADEDGKEVTAPVIGYPTEIYAVFDYDVYTVTIVTDAGVKSVALNGVEMITAGGNTFTTLGYIPADTYKVTYTLKSGYSGTAVLSTETGTVLKDNTFAITPGTKDLSLVFQLAGIEPTPEPEPEPTPTPEEKSEWTVTTILLCVLVVLIAIMAVIVALRLNRN